METGESLTPEQANRIARLSAKEVAEIDASLLHHSAPVRRKVARVVALAMNDVRYEGLPDIFFAERVVELVASGKLEGFGNVRSMRFSEVKLPDSAGPDRA